jgi:hypothetical protein
MSDIARLCLLCGIGADNHLKKTADLCKKIAKSFVKPDLGRASSVHLSTAEVGIFLLRVGLTGTTFPLRITSPLTMLTSYVWT